jgi:hypothetical protein
MMFLYGYVIFAIGLLIGMGLSAIFTINKFNDDM